MYTCMHSAHAYTHTLVLLAGVQGVTYTHTGLAGRVQGGTYTHTGLAGLDARGNIHTHRPGCKGEHTHTLAWEYQEDNKNWSKSVLHKQECRDVSLKKGDVMLSVASFIWYFLKWHP